MRPASERAGGAGTRGGGASRPPGHEAERPSQIPARGWIQILKRAYSDAKDDRISLVAAGVAFYAFLSIFPAMLAALTVYGLLAEPAEVQRQLEGVSGALPEEARQVLENQLGGLAAGGQGALTLGLVLSLLAALWSASGGVAGLMQGINIAYHERETRGFARLRATALLLTLGSILFVLVSVALIAVLPAVLDRVGLGAAGRAGVQVVRWGLLLGFVLVALAVVYRFAPNRSAPRFRWVTLGAVAATALWIIGSVGFSIYVNNFGSYQKTYGAIAGVIVLLLWLYLSSYVVLLGAEVNAEMEHQTARDSTAGPEQPMGERGAVKADTLPPPSDRSP
jgi:membrane protein